MLQNAKSHIRRTTASLANRRGFTHKPTSTQKFKDLPLPTPRSSYNLNPITEHVRKNTPPTKARMHSRDLRNFLFCWIRDGCPIVSFQALYELTLALNVDRIMLQQAMDELRQDPKLSNVSLMLQLLRLLQSNTSIAPAVFELIEGWTPNFQRLALNGLLLKYLKNNASEEIFLERFAHRLGVPRRYVGQSLQRLQKLHDKKAFSPCTELETKALLTVDRNTRQDARMELIRRYSELGSLHDALSVLAASIHDDLQVRVPQRKFSSLNLKQLIEQISLATPHTLSELCLHLFTIVSSGEMVLLMCRVEPSCVLHELPFELQARGRRESDSWACYAWRRIPSLAMKRSTVAKCLDLALQAHLPRFASACFEKLIELSSEEENFDMSILSTVFVQTLQELVLAKESKKATDFFRVWRTEIPLTAWQWVIKAAVALDLSSRSSVAFQQVMTDMKAAKVDLNEHILQALVVAFKHDHDLLLMLIDNTVAEDDTSNLTSSFLDAFLRGKHVTKCDRLLQLIGPQIANESAEKQLLYRCAQAAFHKDPSEAHAIGLDVMAKRMPFHVKHSILIRCASICLRASRPDLLVDMLSMSTPSAPYLPARLTKRILFSVFAKPNLDNTQISRALHLLELTANPQDVLTAKLLALLASQTQNKGASNLIENQLTDYLAPGALLHLQSLLR